MYGPRKPRPRLTDPFVPYLRERVTAYPSQRLWRELRERGYTGGYTAVTDLLRELRPTPLPAFEVRFETPRSRRAIIWLCLWESGRLKNIGRGLCVG